MESLGPGLGHVQRETEAYLKKCLTPFEKKIDLNRAASNVPDRKELPGAAQLGLFQAEGSRSKEAVLGKRRVGYRQSLSLQGTAGV